MSAKHVWRCSGIDGFAFDLICDIDATGVARYCQSMRQVAATIAKEWSVDLSTEWTVRNYLAVKMIMAAQLQLNAAHYASRKNLLIVQPYLMYYSLLCCCRAVLFTDLFTEWRHGDLRTLPHDTVRKCTENALRWLSCAKAKEFEEVLIRAKHHRELLSYSFPATGVREFKAAINLDEIGKVAALLCEVAELNSECLEAAWNRHSGIRHEPKWDELTTLCTYEGSPGFSDDHDAYRAGYMMRKHSGPVALAGIATAGMIEDFFGAWCEEDESPVSEDRFNPDWHEGPSLFSFS